ncbi:M23 family metallopeptidase [Cryobacterium algoritolerans]|uniref:M23 family metallopeptidase n=1 Tax=Cryobacterium algoritolerans TaxID=1259184 RepID=A0A4R8WIN6_9MICO|nr:M23 family metallopeptidase [Cryobacterium algoritolerans]TFC10429.1 M23 family metallopeptidase [Cryobacterium algoritolerans]
MANPHRPRATDHDLAAHPVRSRWIAGLATLALAAFAGVSSPAEATEYPSWGDVQNARSSEAAKQAQIGQLTSLISALNAEVATAQALQAKRSSEFETAQIALDEANYRADKLQGQATTATQQANASQQQAGRIASSLARSGGADLSLTLLLNSGNADALLSQLGSMSKLTEHSDRVYRKAANERNSAQSLTDQARLARSILADLSQKAQTALAEATTANAALQAKLGEQQDNATTLAAQLAVLQENRQATEADFQKGEDARRAAAAAAAAAAANVGTGGGGQDSGQLSDQGWALPVSGWISDSFGPRPNKPVAGVGPFHSGTDLAAPCGRSVRAATGGTVVYAGWLGSYGNWVLVDHGNGVQTGYAHNSVIRVGVGQRVSAGEVISDAGTTGASSGCHLHFEVRVDGARIDPQPFMNARGVSLG